ncbi:GerMN domain-containing protein [Bacillus sonorensis]|uniref:Anti-sigma-X-factor RsiX n=2 Tax=Bacillus sonorensis TaxID=119858 RepID=M5PAH1_9BACI|nr:MULTISPECIES: GerMN domain-containing protein [Bacillus]EME76524.1 anti-sigma-X-factor RsiX [Bacillus sonorensis L12]MBG9915521.1 RsiX protein [Bacillus sonorensis]MCF7618021.1 GerMN domain-containing protein [Bacillus sonorensis]MCY7856741.1 GerMN domain-containing protein [Bacillus sonorensis]MCY8024300.1 GerMN domain-containing protein [Bacillus sonorensis]
MKKSEWNEERLKMLLSQLPTVKDDRSAKQIYQKLLLAQPKMKSPKNRAGAFAATVMVLFLLMLITPQLVDQIRSQSGEKADIASGSQSNIEAGHGEAKTADAGQSKPATTFVVPSDQKDNYVTLAFLDDSDSVIVPVSIRKGTGVKSVEDALNEYGQLDVDQFKPFNTSFLQNIKFDEEKESKTVTIQVDENISGISSGDFQLMKKVLNETFKWSSYNSVQFVSNGEPGIEVDSYGMLMDLSIEQQSQRGYLLYDSADGKQYLVPSNDSYRDIKEAIRKMQQGESGSHLTSIIPSDRLIQSVEENGKELIIHFSSSADIQNQTDDILMLEGLLLTAKDFGFTKVKFMNANINRVGSYDLSKSIPVPYAPNPITIKK